MFIARSTDFFLLATIIKRSGKQCTTNYVCFNKVNVCLDTKDMKLEQDLGTMGRKKKEFFYIKMLIIAHRMVTLYQRGSY